MYQHVAVRENDSKARTSQNQGRPVYDALTAYKQSTVLGWDVRTKTFANGELRITFPQVQAPAKGGGAKADWAGGFDEALAALVYNEEVPQTNEAVSGPVRRPRNLKPTRYAMHTVREACSVIEEKYGRDCYFITLTLPGRTPEAIEAFAGNSTGIMDAFMQRYRHFLQHDAVRLQHQLIENDWCWVAEYHKDGALHYHLLIGMKSQVVVRALRKLVKKWWRKVLLHYSRKTDVDLYARKEGGSWKDCKNKPRTQFAKVKKSVSRYMSKYLSKMGRAAVDENWAPPAAWYGKSDSVWEQVQAKRGMDGMTGLSKDAAENIAVKLAEIGQDMGGKVYPMQNPFTGSVCGYVLFFDDNSKDAVYERWSLLMDWWKTENPELGIRPPPKNGECVSLYPDKPDPIKFWDAREFNPRAFGCADLCAPFSATEKGGGMRYH